MPLYHCDAASISTVTFRKKRIPRSKQGALIVLLSEPIMKQGESSTISCVAGGAGNTRRIRTLHEDKIPSRKQKLCEGVLSSRALYFSDWIRKNDLPALKRDAVL